jgi:hypothetical protein
LVCPDKLDRKGTGDARHAHLPICEREHFSRADRRGSSREQAATSAIQNKSERSKGDENPLGERNGTLSNGVDSSEEEDEEGDAAKTSIACALRDQETKSGGEEKEGHLQDGKKEGERGAK